VSIQGFSPPVFDAQGRLVKQEGAKVALGIRSPIRNPTLVFLPVSLQYGVLTSRSFQYLIVLNGRCSFAGLT